MFLEIYFLFLKVACGRLSVPSRIVKEIFLFEL